MVAVYRGSCPGCQFWFWEASLSSSEAEEPAASFSSQSVTPGAEDKIKSEPVNGDKVSLTWHATEGRREMSCCIHTSSYFTGVRLHSLPYQNKLCLSSTLKQLKGVWLTWDRGCPKQRKSLLLSISLHPSDHF